MGTRRRYDDSCGMAQGLNLVGERWALHVVRELLFGPKRFTDLRADLPGVSPNVLSQRLTDLETAGVLYRRRLPPPAAAWVYELTEWGAGLEDVIITLGRWAASWPGLDRDSPLSTSSVILSMRTMFHAAAAAGVQVTLELRLGERRFRADVDDGALVVEPGTAPDADAVVTTTPHLLAQVLYDGRSLTDATTSGDLVLDGDHSAVVRYLELFRLPEPAR